MQQTRAELEVEGPDCQPVDPITKLKEEITTIHHNINEMSRSMHSLGLKSKKHEGRLNWQGPHVWASYDHAMRYKLYESIEDWKGAHKGGTGNHQ